MVPLSNRLRINRINPEERSGMVIADVHTTFGHRDVVFVWMVNDCQDVDLLAYR